MTGRPCLAEIGSPQRAGGGYSIVRCELPAGHIGPHCPGVYEWRPETASERLGRRMLETEAERHAEDSAETVALLARLRAVARAARDQRAAERALDQWETSGPTKRQHLDDDLDRAEEAVETALAALQPGDLGDRE